LGDDLGVRFEKSIKHLIKRTILRDIVWSAGLGSGGRFFLTFDDGPDPQLTPVLLDVLEKHSVKASFFWVGENAERYSWLCRETLARGHMGCNHTLRHVRLKGIPFRQIRWEIEATDKLLHSYSSAPNLLIRPPHGEIGPVLALYAWLNKRKLVLWTLDPEDCQVTSAKAIESYFDKNPIKAGDIVLLHEDARYTAEALDSILSATLRKGLSAATLADLWRDNSRHAGNSGRSESE